MRTASRELHDLRAFEHDEVRRVRSKAILLDRLSATDHVGSGSQVRGPPDYQSPSLSASTISPHLTSLPTISPHPNTSLPTISPHPYQPPGYQSPS